MEVLQVIKNLSNTEEIRPGDITKCELLYDAENVRVLLMLRLDGIKATDEAYVDICCYDNSGEILNVMENIPYNYGGMYVELTSLMTAHAEVILRSVNSDGIKWKSESLFSSTHLPEDGSARKESASEEGAYEEAVSEEVVLEEAVEEEAVSEADDYETADYEDCEEAVEEIAEESGDVSDDTVQFDSAAVSEAVEKIEKRNLTRAERRALRKEKAAEEEEIRQFIKNDPGEKKKRIISRIITTIAVIGICVGGFYALRYISSANDAYSRGINLYNSGKFGEAIPELESVNKHIIFGEKADELNWALAMSYCRQRDFFPAALLFHETPGYKESNHNFRSIIQAFSGTIAAGGNHTAALTSEGEVIASGNDDNYQCDTRDFEDIIRVAAGENHTIVLTRDSEVDAVGDNDKEQCETDRWDDIIAIACGSNHSVGVEKNGRVEAVGDNTYGQCEVDDWSGIVAVAAGGEHTVGLKIDGTVVACGNNLSGACNVGEWSDIAAVAAGNGFTVGLTYNGKVLFTGDKTNGVSAVKRARNVISISAGASHVLVLHEDGTVSSYGSNDSGQGNTQLWANVVAISAGARHSVAVRADGTVLGTGSNTDGQIDIMDFTGIGLPKSTVTIRKAE